jgi:hypothetical protein
MTAAMLAPLGTLPFLATLWLLFVLGAKLLEESGGKIAAALKGTPSQPANDVGVRHQARSRNRAPAAAIRANVEWRAAA